MKFTQLFIAIALLAGLMSVCAQESEGSSESATSLDPSRLVVSVEKVATLTGPEATDSTKEVDICGTDIGTMTELNGNIYFAFGDTFGFRGDSCPNFGPNWRSNVLGISSDHNPADGINWDAWLSGEDGTAIAMTEGAHQPPFTGEQTRIPTAMVTVGDRLYLHYMSVHGFAKYGGVWLCNYSRFIYSDDEGQSWIEAAQDFGGHGDTFNMLALSYQAGAGNEEGRYVYAVGTPCGRFGGARVARVPADQLLNLDAWEYYTGTGWSEARNEAVEVIKPPVGEGSLLWNPGLQRWMYSYLNEDTHALELRLAPNPWGPWGEAHTLATAADYPALYGAYMTPSFAKDDGKTFYFVMSQFGPYNTYIMKANLSVRGKE